MFEKKAQYWCDSLTIMSHCNFTYDIFMTTCLLIVCLLVVFKPEKESIQDAFKGFYQILWGFPEAFKFRAVSLGTVILEMLSYNTVVK